MIIDTNENKFVELISNIPNVAVQGYDKERRVIYWGSASFKNLLASDEFRFLFLEVKLLFNESIEQWCKREETKKLRFDLGLCTSVFQYLSEDELKMVVPIMATRLKYLYLTVPTDIELDRQIEELEFHDTYALRRSRKFYRDILSPHFTNISSKLWESKKYFDEETTLFTDLLYRS